MARRKVQADYDVNQDGVVDEQDTVEVEEAAPPRVFGWVAGRNVNRQIHPDTNPEVL